MVLPNEQFSNQGDNQLFQLLKTQKWKAATQLLEPTDNNEEAATKLTRETDRYGNTPLHTAIGFQAPEHLILKLLELHPDATTVHGTDCWLPLHVAAMWGSTPAIMERLIRLHPAALDDRGEPGIKGRTPRHFAARFNDERREMLERSTEQWMALVAAAAAPKNEEKKSAS